MKWVTLLLTLALLTALTVSPASALEYSFNGAEDYDFARPTSDDTIHVDDYTNVDRSKDTALMPPMPFAVPAMFTETVSPACGAGFTTVADDLRYEDGSIGVLTIPTLGVNVKIYQGTDSATLAKGAGHFTDTSIWAGNVCVAGHNRGINCYFGNIHTLNIGDGITLTTKLGTRIYSVTSVQKVSETDSSGTAATFGNQITLYTCVRNERAYRWCVTAKEEVV